MAISLDTNLLRESTRFAGEGEALAIERLHKEGVLTHEEEFVPCHNTGAAVSPSRSAVERAVHGAQVDTSRVLICAHQKEAQPSHRLVTVLVFAPPYATEPDVMKDASLAPHQVSPIHSCRLAVDRSNHC